jgi:DNA-binding Lrp family transcriptional regulator
VTRESSARTVTIDALDRQILHAVQINGRAPFALIADVIGVSEQTVARRYRRMESAGLVRVLGLAAPEALGVEQWLLRIQCRPDASAALAEALARRTDVRWVSLSAGGSEVVCSAQTQRGARGQDLLLRRLPRTAQVQRLSAHSVMHRFQNGPVWHGFGDRLSDRQIRRLEVGPSSARVESGESGRLGDGDAALMDGLGQDGRISLRRLADRTGWTPVRVGRRIEALHASGALYFDVDLDLDALGFTAMSYIWVTVAPRDLAAAGEALNAHDEVAFCAAVTGAANLVLAVLCRDSADLYRYVTTRLGTLDAIREIETSPVLRRIKQAGTILTDRGIASPAPPSSTR